MPKFIGRTIDNSLDLATTPAPDSLVRLSYSQAALLPAEEVYYLLDETDRGSKGSYAKRWHRWFATVATIEACERSTAKMLAAAAVRRELGHWGSVAERAVALYSLRCLSRCLVDAAALGLLASRGLEIDLGALDVMGDVIESVGGDRRIAQAAVAYTTGFESAVGHPYAWAPARGYAVTAAEQYVPVAL